jgi:hypothetical protein
MPGSHFHPTLNVDDDGLGLYTSGPFTIDDDMESIRVVAVVTQQPQQQSCEGGQTRGASAQPRAAICHGDIQLTPGDVNRQRDSHGSQGIWSFQGRAVGNIPFVSGWGRGIAFALVIQKDGDLETYSWSEWVRLVRP